MNNRVLPIAFLSALFSASVVISNLLGASLVLVYGFTLSCGVFVIPLIFISIDMINEIYGEEVTKKIIYIGFFIQILTLVFTSIGGAFPPSPRRDLYEEYHKMFGLLPRMSLASIVAYFVSTYVDVRVFTILTKSFNHTPLWLKSHLSTIVSQIFDVAIFYFIFLGGEMPFGDLLKVGTTLYVVKVALILLNSPFLLIIQKLLIKRRR